MRYRTFSGRLRRLYENFIVNIRIVVELLAQQAGASYENMSELWQVPGNRLLLDPATRRAHMFRTLALQAIRDDKVTLGELQTLVRVAKLAAER